MILVRQVFRVKWGQMDKVLAALKSASASTAREANVHRVLTDISGDNFTLVFETKTESMDAYWKALQASFEGEGMGEAGEVFMEYLEAGHREFYTIEYEA
jgi:hypothetical protein